jgi:hypothetical protein
VDNMKTFVIWFLEQLPSFLLSEPMCYFVGFAFLIVTIRVIRDIIRI